MSSWRGGSACRGARASSARRGREFKFGQLQSPPKPTNQDKGRFVYVYVTTGQPSLGQMWGFKAHVHLRSSKKKQSMRQLKCRTHAQKRHGNLPGMAPASRRGGAGLRRFQVCSPVSKRGARLFRNTSRTETGPRNEQAQICLTSRPLLCF